MRHFYRSVFTLGLMILFLARFADAQTQAPAKPAPRATAKTPAQTAAKPTATKSAAAKPAPLEVPQLKFEKYKLENGLDVIPRTIGFRSLRSTCGITWVRRTNCPAAPASRICSST